MSAGGGAYPIVPPLPEFEERKSSDQTAAAGAGKTTQELAQVQEQALRDQAAAFEAQKAGTGEVRAQAEKAATIEAQGQQAEAGAAAYKLAQLSSPEALQADQMIERARQHVQQEQARLAAKPPPALFADSTGWDKVRKSIALTLGGFGDAIKARAAILAGHAPGAGDTVLRIIDMDVERQKAAIDKLRDSVVMSRTGLSDAEEARRELRQGVDLKAMAMVDAAKKLTAARLGALKIDQPAIDQHQAILALDQKKADFKAEYVKGLTTSLQSHWDKSTKTGTEEVHRVPTATGGAGNVPGQQAALARQVQVEAENLQKAPPLSEDTLQKLQSNELRAGAADESIASGPIKGIGATVGREVGAIPRNRYEGLSEQDRKTATSMDSMVQMLSHVMTGAGMTMSEATKKAGAFGFVPGDTPATMQDKLKRANELAGQFTRAPTTTPGAPPAAGTPAPSPPPSKERTEAIRSIKAHPSWRGLPNVQAIMKKYSIADAEVR